MNSNTSNFGYQPSYTNQNFYNQGYGVYPQYYQNQAQIINAGIIEKPYVVKGLQSGRFVDIL